MKKLLLFLFLPLLLLPSCGQTEETPPPEAPKRVVSLYASYSAAWLAAGGELAGVTDDAVSERQLSVGDAELVGSAMRPSLEKILALEPDLVLASPDVPGQFALQEQFENLGIDARYYSCDDFSQYEAMMEEFLSFTGRDDLREQLVDEPRAQIQEAKERAQGKAPPTVLLLRVNPSGVQAKADGTTAAEILRDLGAVNIAEQEPSLLQELSLEVILQEDPGFILVAPHGARDAQAAIDDLDPAWKTLSGQFIALPKELFHYKPNERWGEAYEQLAAILYP
jgi:iron complex transport system substrate-binding protein